MKRIVTATALISTLFDVNCVDMRNVSFRQDESTIDSLTTGRDVSSIRSRTPPLEQMTSVRSHTPTLEYAMPYIPQHYDHTEEFHNESVLCFKMRRWVFQPLSVTLQITAGGLLVGGQCCIDKYPETAKILNGAGLGVSIASFVVNTLLLKIDNKLEEMDRYIIERREEIDRNNRNIIPTIIQR